MANETMTLIETQTLTTTAANFTFTVPATYTDLYLVLSARSSRTGYADDEVIVRFNGSTTGYSYKELQGNGSSASSFGNTNNGIYRGAVPAANATSNTFSNNQYYIPNYAGATNKSVSLDTTAENNATGTRMVIIAGLWSNTAAITSISLTPEVGPNFVAGSTASLYGIKSAGYGAKATGGLISQAGGYIIHSFYSSGTFTPTQDIASVEYLVVAGGGGGGLQYGGGGGAGGLVVGTATSLTNATPYTVTIGAGGAGATNQSGAKGSTGSNSVFSSITANGGGGGGGWGASIAGANGGSGGGGAMGSSAGSSGAAGTATQTSPAGGTGYGFAGGTGWYAVSDANYKGGGGGGAGAAGTNAPQDGTTSGANGGIGYQSSITGTATYYAGGGGGHNHNGTSPTSGGLGGGGNGSTTAAQSTAGTTNTGGGGGSGGNNTVGGLGKAGGSGIVIVRYPA